MLICQNTIFHSHFLCFYYFDKSISPISYWFFVSELPFILVEATHMHHFKVE